MSEQNNGISRRSVLKGAAVGGLGIAAGGSLLAGCGSKATGPLAYGARSVDAGPTAQNEALIAAYTAKTGNEVKYNATESNAFQNNLSQYLQGTPDDTFEWMAGYRMQFFAEQGLLADLTGVWDAIGDQYSESYKIASTGLDGKQYFVPKSWYPWGLHFRKSMFADLGLNADNVTNWDEYLKMLDGMKKKGLVGFAAGDKGGWEAMGTFDIINARVNGYQFHVDLLAGREKWTDAKVVTAVNHFNTMLTWANSDHKALDWTGAVAALAKGTCAMNVMGDWAYGELIVKQQKKDNIDFGYTVIGDPKTFVTVGDSFVIGAKSKNPAAGEAFAKAVMDPKVQIAFNKLKGSAPYRTDVSTASLGTYQRAAAKTLATGTLVASLVHGQQLVAASVGQAFSDGVTVLQANKDAAAFGKAMNAATKG